MKSRPSVVVLSVSLLLTACASTHGSSPQVLTVEVPVAVSCRPNLAAEPQWPDTDEAIRSASGLFARVQLLAAGRLVRLAWQRQLSAALKACAG